ncbi:SGNH/GDSL hydrolase family protein [Mesoflavibacter zeaxanthinifaciens]|uniref:SGNH/GDSL hydrolase family protein n=1 Tax=Mesoflavibacter zeaxanthinifaciens TaxID=393060 RepID=UPI0004178DA0|nr:SGNH/GDSL hydrolase family protein [Mesoflavibacter zeaxanthinifaciens]
MKQLTLFISVIFILFLCCNATDSNQSNNIETLQTTNYRLLSLGDSYTIGESVCETCRFPEQLKDSLINNTENTAFNLKVVATTGWTTTNLLNGISNENLPNNYDLVTLLIGVNNQYQGKDFSIYETEFPELVDIAITKAKGDKNRVIVVSIPDYAFTPFGNGNTTISSEIDAYNAFAENYCNTNNITFVNITDITRNGFEDTDLVASDGLHPSEKAYSLFVERLLPYALEKL